MTQQTFEKAFDSLQTAQRSRLQIGSYEVDIARSADLQELYLATPVFFGGNYIPQSVRAAISGQGLRAADGLAQASLVIDEVSFKVSLHYRVNWVERNPVSFASLMDDFLTLAEVWRDLLDEHGQQDLVYVPKS